MKWVLFLFLTLFFFSLYAYAELSYDPGILTISVPPKKRKSDVVIRCGYEDSVDCTLVTIYDEKDVPHHYRMETLRKLAKKELQKYELKESIPMLGVGQ